MGWFPQIHLRHIQQEVKTSEAQEKTREAQEKTREWSNLSFSFLRDIATCHAMVGWNKLIFSNMV
jgi:hypothetical protein